MNGDAIHVSGLRLWAHVGVLESERQQGQWFELAFRLGHDLGPAGRTDDLGLSLDYGTAITALQRQAARVRCHTLEAYAERIQDLLEQLYGAVPQRLILCKCAAPVPGFGGRVCVERSRHAGAAGWGAPP